jgi:hypothetical protein
MLQMLRINKSIVKLEKKIGALFHINVYHNELHTKKCNATIKNQYVILTPE